MIEPCPRLLAVVGRIYVVVPVVSIFPKVHLIHPKARSWMRPFVEHVNTSVLQKQQL